MNLKAIETLKEFREDINKFLNSFDEEYKKDEEYMGAKTTLLKINEAIKELEILQNKSCENCKYFQNRTLKKEEWQECKMFYIETRDMANVSIFDCRFWESNEV